jgi:molybdopterin synthase sulfur carrier subunit
VSDTGSPSNRTETQVILVRYWASAREAAGTESESLAVAGPTTLLDLVRRLADEHVGSRLPQVLEACSVLVGDRPVKSQDPATVVVQPGESVEFLPPFAGG